MSTAPTTSFVVASIVYGARMRTATCTESIVARPYAASGEVTNDVGVKSTDSREETKERRYWRKVGG